MSNGRGLSARMRDAYFASPLHRWRIAGPAPEDFAVTLTDAWPGDPDGGREILEGTFSFGATSSTLGADPWTQDSLPPHMADGLHRFEWLRDLRDLGGDAARRRARDLIGAWLDRHDRWHRHAWRPDLLGARLAAWIGMFGFFGESADDSFRTAVLDSLARQHRHLLSAISSSPQGPEQFETIRGAIIASVALGATEDVLKSLTDQLAAAIDAQVLGDGGHRSRAPTIQADVLAALVDVRAALRAADRDPPAILDKAIQDMTGVLRMLRHGDGGLALFNGAVEGQVWRLDALIARTESKARAAVSAPDIGIERMTAGRSIVIVDAGAATGADGMAHAGTLAFELSVGRERLIVNCGAAPGDLRWETALRASAAHSTLVIDDTNTSEIRSDGSLGRHVTAVRQERWEAEGSVWLEAEHDGYRDSHSVLHRRRLYLAAGGDDLRGEDTVSYTGGPGQRPVEAAIRFHLHPRISASLVQNGNAALLRTPSGAGWRLRSSGGRLALNESVYFGQRGRMQRTRQLVITVPLDSVREAESVSIKWGLRREDRRTA